MYGLKNIRYRTIMIIVFLMLSCIVFAQSIYANGGSVVSDKEELISLAKQIAAKNKIDVDKCDVRYGQQRDSVTVEFWPKDVRQLGGGGKVFFKKANGKDAFDKIELWQ